MSVRELHNNGGAVFDDLARGQVIIVTRNGVEVAELRPRPRPALSARELIAHRRLLPPIDVERLRQNVDDVAEQTL